MVTEKSNQIYRTSYDRLEQKLYVLNQRRLNGNIQDGKVTNLIRGQIYIKSNSFKNFSFSKNILNLILN